MGDKRKPWEIPISYNEDRWEQPIVADAVTDDDDQDERDINEVEAMIRRGPRDRPLDSFKSTDTTPLDYAKGPSDEEYGEEE